MHIKNRAFTLSELKIISAANEEIRLLERKLLQANMWKIERQALLEMTNMLDEHPEGYEGPCLCKLCCSCF